MTLSQQVYEECPFLKRENATWAVEVMFDKMASALSNGETVFVMGFGTFRKQTRKGGTKVLDRHSGETLLTADRVTVVLDAHRALRMAVGDKKPAVARRAHTPEPNGPRLQPPLDDGTNALRPPPPGAE